MNEFDKNKMINVTHLQLVIDMISLYRLKYISLIYLLFSIVFGAFSFVGLVIIMNITGFSIYMSIFTLLCFVSAIICIFFYAIYHNMFNYTCKKENINKNELL